LDHFEIFEVLQIKFDIAIKNAESSIKSPESQIKIGNLQLKLRKSQLNANKYPYRLPYLWWNPTKIRWYYQS